MPSFYNQCMLLVRVNDLFEVVCSEKVVSDSPWAVCYEKVASNVVGTYCSYLWN